MIARIFTQFLLVVALLASSSISSARFIQVDPAAVDPNNVHSFNRYAYGNNNPYKFHDPDGRQAVGIGWIEFSPWQYIKDVNTQIGVTVGAIALPELAFGRLFGPAALQGAKQLSETAAPKMVSESAIRDALRGSEMQTTQGSISRPVVENYVRRLEAGEVAPAIKVDGKVIVDGNHRYAAGRVFGKEPAQTPGSLSPSQASKVKPVQNTEISPADFGNR